jgi:hypothetical protein
MTSRITMLVLATTYGSVFAAGPALAANPNGSNPVGVTSTTAQSTIDKTGGQSSGSSEHSGMPKGSNPVGVTSTTAQSTIGKTGGQNAGSSTGSSSGNATTR